MAGNALVILQSRVFDEVIQKLGAFLAVIGRHLQSLTKLKTFD